MARSITKSVGDNGFNLIPDVCTVQDLLNLVPSASGGPATLLHVDGLAFGKTQDAIRQFQRVALRMARPDGRVDPGGHTLTKLQSFEGNGSQRFEITRFELARLTGPRTADTPDRFYEIAAVGGQRKMMYFFSRVGDRLANPQSVLSQLTGRGAEKSFFSTQLVHSVAGFQVKDGLHSEKFDNAGNSLTALSLVLPGEPPPNIRVSHRYLSPTSQPGVTRNLRGQFVPVGELGVRS